MEYSSVYHMGSQLCSISGVDHESLFDFFLGVRYNITHQTDMTLGGTSLKNQIRFLGSNPLRIREVVCVVSIRHVGRGVPRDTPSSLLCLTGFLASDHQVTFCHSGELFVAVVGHLIN